MQRPASLRNPSSLLLQAPAVGRTGAIRMSWGVLGGTDKVQFSISTGTCGKQSTRRETQGTSARNRITTPARTRQAKIRDRLGRGPQGRGAKGTRKVTIVGRQSVLSPPLWSNPATKCRPQGKPDQRQLWPTPSLTTEAANQLRCTDPLPAPNRTCNQSDSRTPWELRLQIWPPDGQGPPSERCSCPCGSLPTLTSQGRQRRAGLSNAFAGPPTAIATFSAMTESGNHRTSLHV